MQLDLFRDFTAPPPPWRPRHPDDVRARVLAAVAVATASQVAVAHGLTTNAVLGLVHRARQRGAVVPTLAPRPRPTAGEVVVRLRELPRPTVRAPTIGTPMPLPDPEPVVAVVDVVPVYGPVDLMLAGPRQCRAVEGESDGLGGARCCGMDTGGRSSWCEAHRALFRRPARLRPVR